MSTRYQRFTVSLILQKYVNAAMPFFFLISRVHRKSVPKNKSKREGGGGDGAKRVISINITQY